MENRIRLGIIGLGEMGMHYATQTLLPGAVPEITLAAVCDGREQRMAEIPQARAFSSATDLIASGCVDAVLVATPHFSHTPLGIAALEAGLHVLMEKPISVHKADCEKLLAAHQRDEQSFAAMFVMRTYPPFQTIKNIITSGTLGTLRRVNWILTDWFRSEAYYRAGSWRGTWEGEGGGVLLNQCPHQLDLWQWLFGMPKRVYARCSIGRYHDIEVEDDVAALLEYEDGLVGSFITSTGESPGTNRLEIIGDMGKLVLENGVIQFLRNTVSMTEFCQSTETRMSGPASTPEEIAFDTVPKLPHTAIFKNFAANILRGETLIAPAREGIHSVELANTMLLSSIRGTPLDLPINSGDFAAELSDLINSSKRKI